MIFITLILFIINFFYEKNNFIFSYCFFNNRNVRTFQSNQTNKNSNYT